MGYDGTSIIGVATDYHEACKLIAGNHSAMNLIKDVRVAECELNKPMGSQMWNDELKHGSDLLIEWEKELSK